MPKTDSFPIGDQLKEWFKEWIKSDEGKEILKAVISEIYHGKCDSTKKLSAWKDWD